MKVTSWATILKIGVFNECLERIKDFDNVSWDEEKNLELRVLASSITEVRCIPRSWFLNDFCLPQLPAWLVMMLLLEPSYGLKREIA